MSKVIAIMSMSLDGYVADRNDGVNEVFDWYVSSGDYDRAGLGQSDKSPFPRTSPQIVAGLRTLLQQAQYAGPLILVGHSLGLNMHCFALHHPQEVAGMLLVDPPFPDFITGLHQLLTPDQRC